MQIYWKIKRIENKGDKPIITKYLDADAARADAIYFKDVLNYAEVELLTVIEKDNGEIIEEISD